MHHHRRSRKEFHHQVPRAVSVAPERRVLSRVVRVAFPVAALLMGGVVRSGPARAAQAPAEQRAGTHRVASSAWLPVFDGAHSRAGAARQVTAPVVQRAASRRAAWTHAAPAFSGRTFRAEAARQADQQRALAHRYAVSLWHVPDHGSTHRAGAHREPDARWPGARLVSAALASPPHAGHSTRAERRLVVPPPDDSPRTRGARAATRVDWLPCMLTGTTVRRSCAREAPVLNPAQTARDIALAAHFRARGVSITYGRGAGSVTVTALLGNTEDLRTEDNRATLSTSRDFIVKAATLRVGGALVQPARGDVITLSGVTYQVLPLPGQDTHRPLDPRGVYIRIHTRKLGAWEQPDAPADPVTQYAFDAHLRLSGIPITYTSGANSVAITALIGRTRDEETVDGYAIDSDARDYLFCMTDLVLNGAQAIPQRGDQIRADGVTWQVLPIDGSAVWRPMDPRGYAIRVHTRKVTAGGVG